MADKIENDLKHNLAFFIVTSCYYGEDNQRNWHSAHFLKDDIDIVLANADFTNFILLYCILYTYSVLLLPVTKS